MFDLSSKFNSFYNSEVVLSQENQNELYRKKDLNILRLKEGLEEYNLDFGTHYSIVETCVQGSVAMSTVVQNEDNDYDIDVAIVFDKTQLGDKGALATRNIVANALSRKTKLFNADPEVKTSCVRVQYADGYHIDFAVYRRCWSSDENSWVYEHSGSEWTRRDLTGLTDWFKEKNDSSNGKLRKVVRLSKMFCKSRKSWVKMPSGLLQTVLCNERLQNYYERLDELFFYTMKSIVERLEKYKTVSAPVDNGRDLTPRQSDINKMNNWYNKLKSKLDDLEILFKDDCTEEEALQAWYSFFNHNYWKEQSEDRNSSKSSLFIYNSVRAFDDTEEFIEDLFPVTITETLKLNCVVSANGFRPQNLNSFLSFLQIFLPHNFKVHCSVSYTTVQAPYSVLWKVKNVGPEAQRKNDVRGQILNRGSEITENTKYYGNHYIECYIIKNGKCVAREKISVPIGRR